MSSQDPRSNDQARTDDDLKAPSRRGFLKGALFGAVAAGTGATLTPPSLAADGEAAVPRRKGSFDFSDKSGALQADKIVDSACQFCNSLCGLKVHTKNGRVLEVRGENEDPVQDGGLCVKGEMMTQLVYNRLRLERPMIRTGGAKGSPDSRFKEVSWDEALDKVAESWLALRDAGEAHAIANRTTGRMLRGAGGVIGRIFQLLGSPNATDVGPVCNDAGGNALAKTFGLGNFTNGYGVDPATGQEDLGSSKYYLFLGTNQAETHPVTFAYLLRQREKNKARLVVIDPRLTPTGAQADQWLGIKPHTDLAFALGMIGRIIEKDLVDRAFIKRWVLGFQELKGHIKDRGYNPRWAAEKCGIPAETIARVAEDYARARPAAIFCNAGISHQLNAFTTYRALAILASITGNIGRPGGGCNFMHNTWPGGLELPPLKDEPPAATKPALPVGPDSFAASILEAKPYRLKSIMAEGNPLMSSANTERVKEAFKKLDFFIYTGLFMEESAYYADVILPVCSGFEFDGVYMRRDDRGIRWQEQAVPRVGESKTDIEIFVALAQALARKDTKKPKEYWTANIPEAWNDYSTLWAEFVARTPGVGGMTRERMKASKVPLRWPCPSVDHPGVSTLYHDHPSWYQAAEALDPNNKGKRFLTPSGMIEIFTTDLDRALRVAGHRALPDFFTHPEVTGKNESLEYTDTLVPNPVNPQAVTPKVKIGVMSDGKVHEEFPLMGMIGRASVVHFAGVTQWAYDGKQINGERLVQIHPKTAAGIKNGDAITVASPRGQIQATALLWEGIREDTIYVPNSFGPAQILGDDFGLPRYEAANVLVDDRYFDNLSGQQAYKCFACKVAKA